MQVFAPKKSVDLYFWAIVMVCSIMLMLRKEYRCPYGSIFAEYDQRVEGRRCVLIWLTAAYSSY